MLGRCSPFASQPKEPKPEPPLLSCTPASSQPAHLGLLPAGPSRLTIATGPPRAAPDSAAALGPNRSAFSAASRQPPPVSTFAIPFSASALAGSCIQSLRSELRQRRRRPRWPSDTTGRWPRRPSGSGSSSCSSVGISTSPLAPRSPPRSPPSAAVSAPSLSPQHPPRRLQLCRLRNRTDRLVPCVFCSGGGVLAEAGVHVAICRYHTHQSCLLSLFFTVSCICI